MGLQHINLIWGEHNQSGGVGGFGITDFQTVWFLVEALSDVNDRPRPAEGHIRPPQGKQLPLTHSCGESDVKKRVRHVLSSNPKKRLGFVGFPDAKLLASGFEGFDGLKGVVGNEPPPHSLSQGPGERGHGVSGEV
jgi:hypothetical protein